MKRVLCVFVPGVKGSELWCERCQKRAWPPAFVDRPVELTARIMKNGVSARVEDMMNSDEYDCLATHRQTPTAVIRGVRAVYGLYKREVYARFLERLEHAARDVGGGNSNDTVVRTATFPYDWTRSNVETAHSLYYTLAGAMENYDEILLVAHSMGGLVCRYMLENVLTDRECRGADKRSRELLAAKIGLLYGIGVPHYGCIKCLHFLVDPAGGSFTGLCRRTTSVYEMIPFSDLAAQIEGIGYGGSSVERQRRRRSDLFMPEGGEVNVDPTAWRVHETSDRRIATESRGRPGESDPIGTLVSRFPVLKELAGQLVRGLDFHTSLNTDRKPPHCVYVLVNASGVPSPSGIDTAGKLRMECSTGDGTVCSVVARDRGWFGRVRRRLVKRNNAKPICPSVEHSYAHNVHVSMLNELDLNRLMRYFACSDRNERTVHNIVQNVFREQTAGDGGRFRSLTNVISRIACPSTPAAGSAKETYELKEGGVALRTYTVSGHTICRVSLDENLVRETVGRQKPISVVMEHIGWSGVDGDRVRINVQMEGYGHTWDGLRVVLPGRYRPVAVVCSENE